MADLLADIKNSIGDMQKQMQSTYSTLNDEVLEGFSADRTVKITATATYEFKDIDFSEAALQGGVKEFKWRIREAWKDLTTNIQKRTQAKTMELLQGMNIPDEIKNLELEDQSGGEGGDTGANG